ncbi:MAG: hypothetical protein AAFX87_24930 [Bacteroidota bacterium]
MARTFDQIRDELEAAKDAEPTLRSELNANTSPSLTALWKLWLNVVASVILTLENLWDVFRNETDAKIEQQRIGTLSWYVERAREFQTVGNLVILDNGNIGYDNVSEENQIIARVSVDEDFDTQELVMRVAKLGDDNEPTNLSGDELSLFKDYMEAIKFAGTRLRTISVEADILDITGTLYAERGFARSEVEQQVNDAINEFLAELPFNGILLKNQLIDKITDLTSVRDIDIPNMTITFKSLQGDDVEVVEPREFRSVAGYFRLGNLVLLTPQPQTTTV